MTISELEAYFQGIDLFKTIKLNEVITILNIDNFPETTRMRVS